MPGNYVCDFFEIKSNCKLNNPDHERGLAAVVCILHSQESVSADSQLVQIKTGTQLMSLAPQERGATPFLLLPELVEYVGNSLWKDVVLKDSGVDVRTASSDRWFQSLTALKKNELF